MDLDVSADFAAITDWLRPVTVDGTDVDACLRREVKTKEAEASAGKFLTSDTVFHIDANEYASRPAIGGVIVDTDGDWTILSVQWETLVNRWRCISRQLWIDPSLDENKVAIQQATYAKGVTGAEEPTWQTVEENVIARVHWGDSRVAVEHADRVVNSTVKVFFAADRSLAIATRIITSSGATLKVVSWNGFDEIDQFFTATCEVSQWPDA